MSRTPLPQMLLPQVPWYRVPAAWLVVGGPASVVLACIVTAFFVLHGRDRDVRDYDPTEAAAAAAVQRANPTTLPAEQGRNRVDKTMH